MRDAKKGGVPRLSHGTPPFFRMANSSPRCHARFLCIALNPVNARHDAVAHATRAHGTRALRSAGIH
ncbi:hypothetical protein DN582_07035 [Burkholderia multivorans]|nr:hypothetical protein DN582_07035 [Burkholderia multivorans]